MIIEKAGGIIARKTLEGKIEILCIHRSRYNDWSLPKGHVDVNESMEAAALREILEETGLVCEVVALLPDHEYTLPSGETSRVVMFLCTEKESRPEAKDTEADTCVWKELDDALEAFSYPNLKEYAKTVRPIIERSF